MTIPIRMEEQIAEPSALSMAKSPGGSSPLLRHKQTYKPFLSTLSQFVKEKINENVGLCIFALMHLIFTEYAVVFFCCWKVVFFYKHKFIVMVVDCRLIGCWRSACPVQLWLCRLCRQVVSQGHERQGRVD